MASLSNTVLILSDGSLKAIPNNPAPIAQRWRQPHDRELVLPGPSAKSPGRNFTGNSSGIGRYTKGARAIPEPFRLLPDHQTPLDCGCQSLIRACNPMLPDDCVDTILDQAWILTNNTGLDVPGRKNCRTGEYMNDPEARWPAFHAPIWCGGAIARGVEENGVVQLESILTGKPLPTAAEVMEKGLYFHLIEVNASGVPTYMTLAGTDGKRHPVIVPFMTRLPVYCPAAWLHKLSPGFAPDPRWMTPS